jgi:hypothetical protein
MRNSSGEKTQAPRLTNTEQNPFAADPREVCPNIQAYMRWQAKFEQASQFDQTTNWAYSQQSATQDADLALDQAVEFSIVRPDTI